MSHPMFIYIFPVLEARDQLQTSGKTAEDPIDVCAFFFHPFVASWFGGLGVAEMYLDNIRFCCDKSVSFFPTRITNHSDGGFKDRGNIWNIAISERCNIWIQLSHIFRVWCLNHSMIIGMKLDPYLTATLWIIKRSCIRALHPGSLTAWPFQRLQERDHQVQWGSSTRRFGLETWRFEKLFKKNPAFLGVFQRCLIFGSGFLEFW